MLDIALLTILALATIGGLRRGIVSTLGALVGLYAGLTLASTFWMQLAGRLAPWIHDATVAEAISFAVLFAAAYAAVMLIARVVRGAVHLLMLGWLDRLLGAAAGLLEGVLVAELALLLFRLPGAPTGVLSASRIVPILTTWQPTVLGLVFSPFAARVPFLGTLLNG
ncbi:MAG: CvpA family protein [Chloroflexota bacterium]